MLRLNASTSAAGAKKYFNEELDRGDYYLDGRDIGGLWHGNGAARLGLSGEIDKENFHLLCDNVHPQTGEQLTPRQRSNRRVGYDFTFSVPKSVSVLQARTNDEDILKAFRESVVETMGEMEAGMSTRVRSQGRNEDRRTGNMIWGEFVHFTSRPVDGIPDPHLHAHCYVFNATFDEIEDRWKAGQFGGLKQDAPYYEAAFDARFAKRLADLGYEIERNPSRNAKDWQIVGVPESVVDKFSRRTAEIEATAQERGIRTDRLKAEIGAETRATKTSALSPEHVRASWNARLSLDEELAIQAVEGRAFEGAPSPTPRISSEEALEYALAHSFERKSVIGEKRLLESALRHGVGTVTVEEIHRVAGENGEILRRDLQGDVVVTTREVLEEERAMIQFAQSGRGACKPLGRPEFTFEADFLNEQQQGAVDHVLQSQNRVMIISGGAGVGKTTLMREAVRGIEEGGHRVFPFAPSADASRGVLRSEGFENAETVARLLVDSDLQEELEGQVVWIDEAGLLGAKTMRQVFDLAEEKSARVILSGDARQHNSVERGDALRILQHEGGIPAAEVRRIQRQQGDYKEAVSALSRGEIEEGFERLEALGAIREIADEDRLKQLTDDYLKSVLDEKRSALVVSPTHSEGEALTDLLRSGLRERGALGPEDRGFIRQVKLPWTEAERGDERNYAPGMIVQFHQNAKEYKGKVPMLGMTPRGNLAIVHEYETHDRRFQLAYDYRGDVSVVGKFEQKGIRRGEKFVVTGRDDHGDVWMRSPGGRVERLPIADVEKFQVYEGRSIDLAPGDKIRITQNGFTNPETTLSADRAGFGKGTQKHRLNNGAIYEVAGFTRDGDIRLANGWTVGQDYGNWSHGYCVTSHASQGKTVDRVFIAQGEESLRASSAEQFYVSVSRGRESVAIYTDNKEELFDAVRRSGRRMAASELDPPEPGGRISERWRAAALWVNRLADQARAAAERAKDSLVAKYASPKPTASETRAPQSERSGEIARRYGAPERTPEQQTVVDKYTKTQRTPEQEALIEKYTGNRTERGDRDEREGNRNGRNGRDGRGRDGGDE